MQDSLFYTQDKLGFKIDVLLEATAKKSTIYVAVQDGTGAMARAINVARNHMDRIGGGRTIKAEYLGVLIDEMGDQDLGGDMAKSINVINNHISKKDDKNYE